MWDRASSRRVRQNAVIDHGARRIGRDWRSVVAAMAIDSPSGWHLRNSASKLVLRQLRDGRAFESIFSLRDRIACGVVCVSERISAASANNESRAAVEGNGVYVYYAQCQHLVGRF